MSDEDALLTYPDREVLLSEPRFAAFRGTRALVTGGCGFIGSNIVHALDALGCEVTVIDSLEPDQGGNMFNLCGLEGKVDVRVSDIRDAAAVADAVRGRDFVFNTAAIVSHLNSLESPFEDVDVNVRGTLVLLEGIRQHAPEATVIHASTRSVYGVIKSTPVSEDHPMLPPEVNSANKAVADLYHYAYYVAHGMNTISMRLTNTFGPRALAAHHRQGFMNWFIRLAVEGGTFRLYGDGSQVRDLDYIDDTVRAMLLAAITPGLAGEALNIGSGTPVSLKEIAEALIEISGHGRLEYVPFPDDAKRIEIGDYVADTTKIRERLGWQPQVSMREGLKRSVGYYRAYKEHYW
jgi:UDP-glucose 4-epimerase